MGGFQGNPSSSRSQPPVSPEGKVFVTAVGLPDWRQGRVTPSGDKLGNTYPFSSSCRQGQRCLCVLNTTLPAVLAFVSTFYSFIKVEPETNLGLSPRV